MAISKEIKEIKELADTALTLGGPWTMLMYTLERIRELCGPNTGELVIDTNMVAEQIQKHIDTLAKIKAPVIAGDNHEQVIAADDAIRTHMNQINALAICTAPKAIQALVQTAHEVESKKYVSMRPEEE